MADIAAAAGVSRQSATSWLRRHGLQANHRRVERPSTSELVAMLSATGSREALAAHLHVTRPTVSRWLLEAGIQPGKSGRPAHAIDSADVQRRRDNGETWAAIAGVYGVSVNTVQRHS